MPHTPPTFKATQGANGTLRACVWEWGLAGAFPQALEGDTTRPLRATNKHYLQSFDRTGDRSTSGVRGLPPHTTKLRRLMGNIWFHEVFEQASTLPIARQKPMKSKEQVQKYPSQQ